VRRPTSRFQTDADVSSLGKRVTLLILYVLRGWYNAARSLTIKSHRYEFGAANPRVNEPREDGVMTGTNTAKKVFTPPYFLMICALSVLLILPRFGIIAVSVGCASILSAYVAVLPESFRSRSGSMMTASWLVAVMWVAAAVITVLTLMGEIQS
jgi:hypothetical protein